MKTPHTRRHNTMLINGFTLIELIMVIVVVGILAASARALLSTDAFDQRFFFDDALIAMRYANQIAVTQGCAVQFQITNQVGFTLKRDINCTNTNAASYTQDVTRPNTSEAYQNTDWPSGVTLAAVAESPSDQLTKVFYPQGWACDATGNTNSTTAQATLVGTFTQTLNLTCDSGFSYGS